MTEDNSCKKIDTSTPDDDFFPKQNFRPIKAPGNKCQKEFDWVASDTIYGDSVQIEVESINGKLITNEGDAHFQV